MKMGVDSTSETLRKKEFGQRAWSNECVLLVDNFISFYYTAEIVRSESVKFAAGADSY